MAMPRTALLTRVGRGKANGDLPAPRIVLFLDEAHLIFADHGPALTQRIERVMRFIRSKGVGVYFASQCEKDIPPGILAQLSNRVQHAQGGAGPQGAPAQPLGVGVALVSTISKDGSPTPMDRVRVTQPSCLGAPPVQPWRPANDPCSPSGTRALRLRGTVMAFGAMTGGVALAVGAFRVLLGI